MGKLPKATWFFCLAYIIYVSGLKERFTTWAANGSVICNATGTIAINFIKFILGTLSFFTENTAKWARCYIEEAADIKVIFSVSNMTRSFNIEFWR